MGYANAKTSGLRKNSQLYSQAKHGQEEKNKAA